MNTWAWELPSFLPPFVREFRTEGLGEILALGGNLFVESIPGGMASRDTDPLMMEAYRAPFPDYWSRVGTLAFQRDIPLTERDRSARLIASIHERLPPGRPGLLVWGMRDPVFQPIFLDQWRELFPDAETVELEDAGALPRGGRPGRGHRRYLRSSCADAPRRRLDALHVAREHLDAQAVAEHHVQHHAAEALGEQARVVLGVLDLVLRQAAGLEEAPGDRPLQLARPRARAARCGRPGGHAGGRASTTTAAMSSASTRASRGHALDQAAARWRRRRARRAAR